jgi:hypothetical protein
VVSSSSSEESERMYSGLSSVPKISSGSRSRLKSEDHVWFEDRWMVASLCDEWLTTLCGLILG